MKKNSHLARIFWGLTAAVSLLVATSDSSAVILKCSGDPEYNTTPPTGALQDSGWQYQGLWVGFLGTPVSPRCFIAARHVGGSVGDEFVFAGAIYRTTAFWDDPNSDLRIWQVDGQFPYWAPLYTGNDELGRLLVVFGRGTQRGEEILMLSPQTVYATNTFDLRSSGLSRRQVMALYPNAVIKGGSVSWISSTLVTNVVQKGWKTGALDGRMRWGVNRVYGNGSLLAATFDTGGEANEAFLSGGDSSGAVFLQEDGVWKLAGINYAVEGPFACSSSEPGFYGAILDKSGLYTDGLLVPDDGYVRPACFYASRISIRLDWIRSILDANH